MATLSVALDLDRRVSFALQQNAVPLVKQVRLANLTDEPLEGLRLAMRCEPEVVGALAQALPAIAPRATLRLDGIDMPLKGERLVRQTERERGRLLLEVTQGEALLVREEHPIEVLAYDEWSGVESLPEILAAFVLPNHPAVERVLASAVGRLEEATGDPTLDGYRARDPARPRAVARAVYDALCDLQLSYVRPPASFEREGQKVRTPDRVLEARMGTCLDLALLAAACLEQAGLHPLLVLLEGHAFAGLWLADEHFHAPAQAEPLRLVKRAELDLLEFFEATGATARPPLPYDEARAGAHRLLEDPDRFHYAVDVRSARAERILPLPLRASAESFAVVAPRAAEEAAAAPEEPRTPAAPAPDAPPGERTRLDRWKRRLLDLSLRNRLINYRETKKSIPLLSHDLGALEDALAEGATFEVSARPSLMSGDDPRDAAVYRARTGEDAVAAHLAEELAARRLHADLEGEELDRRLLESYRSARLSQEEGGANTLYLALGFLEWFETASSTTPRSAPILLLPLELQRASVREGFRVRMLDEDPRVNVTLLQKLEVDFGLRVEGLEGFLPQDDSGLDVAGILRAVREAVLPFDRWQVREQAALGLFSFTKYLMWLDLEARAEELKRNDVVRHLVERADEPFEQEVGFPSEGELDEALDPAATFAPLDADASQLCAVHAAARGSTFVLQGPPGTGKSQTITNLIAHGLALGQRVLFVSEKMAALKVVARRLERVGLDPFTLELHSNKSSKRQVLEQIRAALDEGRTARAAGWETGARRLGELRARLNTYCDALHRPRVAGESAFRGVARLIGLRDAFDAGLDLGDPSQVDAERAARLREAVEVYEAEARAAGISAGHPLLPVGLDRWKPELPARAETACREVEEALGPLGAACAKVVEAMGLEPMEPTLQELDRCLRWAECIAASPGPAPALVAAGDWAAAVERVRAWIDRGRRRDELRQRLFERYTPELLNLHLPDLRGRLARSAESWPIVRWFVARPARKALASVLTGGRLGRTPDLLADLDAAVELRDLSNELGRPGHEAALLLGGHWKGGEASWDGLDALLDWTERLRGLLAEVTGGEFDLHTRLRDRWIRLAAEGRDFAAPLGESLAEARDRFARVRSGLDGLLRIEEQRLYARATLAEIGFRLRGIAERPDELRGWCSYREACRAMEERGLGPLFHAVEEEFLPLDRLADGFERSFYGWWVAAELKGDPVLGGFSGTRHELAIRRFRGLDEELMALAREMVRERLASRVPTEGAEATRSASSEMGLLHRELSKKRRHLPLRQLFARIPNALARLKPCMLMSPLSVAQYLAPDFPPFDLVVFDEASQIPVWDAVGAIARANRLVVVGDTRQLPPTNFFMKEEGDEPFDAEEVEDLESILEECVAARLPSLRLKWHYRSRHESLIAFSNRHYYDNRLWTFPSVEAVSESMGVRLRPVPDGVYEKGRSRTNPAEARALVDELVRRLGDPVESARSLGVVTFSIPQQALIEDLLEQARREQPALDAFFTDAADEPVFVKNLENVQGDERDVILFSVCYGPDARGRVSMNFGPLNRSGGERRLNVAITRAREEVLVFSTLRPEQIDLARTGAVGVRHLKSFLEYAGAGLADPAAAVGGGDAGDEQTEFERDVARALRGAGYAVDRRVGCSGYRIDLAVRHPDRPGRYLLGVECDGAMYERARTARDRDRLRDAVLRGLGWRLHRIWCLDWYYQPRRELERLLEALRAARRDAPPPPAAEPPAPSEPPTPDSEAGSGPSDASSGVVPVYRPGRARPRKSDLHDPSRDELVAKAIREVVDGESPVVLELLARRVAEAFGVQRVTAKVTERIASLLEPAGVACDGEGVVWAPGMDADSYAQFRLPGREVERQPDEIPLVEIANAAEHLLRVHLSIRREDLARELARLFGFARLGARVQERMDAGIGRLLAAGRALLEEDRVQLPS